ncbi:MAG: HAD-IIIA family hydrolase [Legionellaceae bacterium]|nr:HAD-IIIA family hydrolase [Legionellaceae bacterium]
MIRFSGLLIDLDGTILEDSETIIKSINATQSISLREQICKQDIVMRCGQGGRNILNHLCDKASISFRESWLKDFEQHYFEKMFSNARIYPGSKELIENLYRNKTPFGIVTNRVQVNRHYLPSWIKKTDPFVTVDNIHTPKPDPEMLLYAAKKLNISHESMAYVGDSLNDIKAAKAANMTAIWLKNDSFLINLSSQSDLTVTNLLELLTI